MNEGMKHLVRWGAITVAVGCILGNAGLVYGMLEAPESLGLDTADRAELADRLGAIGFLGFFNAALSIAALWVAVGTHPPKEVKA